MLEKGIYTEETLGDLDAAIKVYQQILSDAKANRPYVAQAQYRIAMCYVKKKQGAAAIKALNDLIASFPDQEAIVADARKQIAKARHEMSDAEIAKIVGDAVTDISTMADGDARIPPLLESVRELKEPAVVKAVAKHFDSEKNTVRRAAIYIVWKGEFSDTSPAVPGLTKLCSHEEDLTRGMAAIALGGMKADSAFDKLADMTSGDKSSYARRAAAYALGLLGKQEARPILEKALKDPEQFVRNNAEAALTMLAKATPSRLPAEVMGYIIGEHYKAYAKAEEKRLRVNTHIYGVDNKYNLYSGGFMDYANQSDNPQPGPISLGNFGKDKPDFLLTDETGQPQKYELRDRGTDAFGRYTLWWTPDKPVQPGAKRLLGYIGRQTRPLPQADGQASLTMQNTFGAAVLENFFLVVPRGMTFVKPSEQPTSKQTVGDFDVYLWQKQVPPNTKHEVTVGLKEPRAVEAVPSTTATAALSGLAGTLCEQGQYEKAGQYYQAWLKIEPGSAEAKAGLAKAQTAQKAAAAAVPIAQAWLKLVDDSKIAESWEQASKLFQAGIAKDKCIAAFKSAREPLGKFRSRKLISATYMTSVPGAPDGQYVVVQCDAVFENKKQAVETVTPMLDKDGEWRVSGYYIK